MSSDDPDKPAQDAGNTITAAFPAPPPFWQNFTSENIKRFEDIRESELASHRRASEQGGGNQDARMEEDGPVGREGKDDKEEERGTIERLGLFDLPAELRYLIPPRIPEDGRYMSFGEEFNLNDPQTVLAARDMPQIYPSTSTSDKSSPPQPRDFSAHPSHLTSLTRSVLLNFLELAGIMAQDPTLHPEKLQDINKLLHNAHNVVNEYRPHQARETLIEVMERRVRERREEVRRVRGLVGRVGRLVEGGEDADDGAIGEGGPQEDGMDVDGDGEARNGAKMGTKDIAALLQSEEERRVEQLERKKAEQHRRVWDALGNLRR